MKYIKIISFIAIVLFTGMQYGCNSSAQTKLKKSKNKFIYCVNYPLYYFAKRITTGITFYKIVFPVPKGWDPAFWKPNTQDIMHFQQANLILLNGADFAKWVKTTTLPQSILVNTSASFKENFIMNKHAITHSHGPYGKHTHGKLAFTTWMDMQQASKQAKAIYQGIVNKLKPLPEQVKILNLNLQNLLKDLQEIDNQFAIIGKKLNNTPVLASHPVYKYFANRYKINLKNVHWEPEEMPSQSEWQNLHNILASHPAKIMIWEEPPITPVAKRLEKLHLKIVVVRHCGNSPPNGDFLSEMKNNISRLTKAIESL